MNVTRFYTCYRSYCLLHYLSSNAYRVFRNTEFLEESLIDNLECKKNVKSIVNSSNSFFVKETFILI